MSVSQPMTEEELKQQEEMKATMHILSPAAWVLDNNFINENQQPFEFDLHRFMIQPYNDTHPDQVIMKSAQVGWSVAAIIKSIHAANFRKLNVIYVLPTRNATHDFVIPKVNPMLDRNPLLKDMLKNTDSIHLKAVGDRFIYFRGAFHRGEAISTTADLVVSDEHDISDQNVLSIYQSRLQSSTFGWMWRFSNPSLPSFGVSELYEDSDQMHWIIKCPHCGWQMYIDFEKDRQIGNHFLDQVKVQYVCGRCEKELDNDDRQSGQWIAKYPNRERRGYWINQLMVPWVSAKKILQQQASMETDVFYNFVLGLPWQASEYIINGEAILRACDPGLADMTDVIIGCDSGKTKHWVMGNAQGVFAYGTTTDWDDIERLIKMYNATAVIDALPDFTIPEQLARKYPGQVFVHYYTHDSKSLNVTERKEGEQFGVLQSDRTKLFDNLAARITGGKMRFFQNKDALQDLIDHFETMYRVVEADTRGIKRARWETKIGKADHYAHATAYYLVGLSMALLVGEAGGVKPNAPAKQKTTFKVDPVTMKVPVEDALGRPFNAMIEKSLARNKRHKVS
jgi:DNA-directed RNA polymerase subunit RPC12/RpoP